MTSGERIKAALAAKGWTQEELARETGLTTRSVWAAANDARVRPRTLRRIFDALGLEFESAETQEAAS